MERITHTLSIIPKITIDKISRLHTATEKNYSDFLKILESGRATHLIANLERDLVYSTSGMSLVNGKREIINSLTITGLLTSGKKVKHREEYERKRDPIFGQTELLELDRKTAITTAESRLGAIILRIPGITTEIRYRGETVPQDIRLQLHDEAMREHITPIPRAF